MMDARFRIQTGVAALALASLISLGFAGAANALPAASTAFVPGVQNQLSDNSAEILLKGTGNAGGTTVEVGDVFLGIQVIGDFSPSGINGSAVNELTTIFAVKVKTVAAAASSPLQPLISLSDFTFEPTAAGDPFTFAAGCDAGCSATTGLAMSGLSNPDGSAIVDANKVVALVFEDHASDFNRDGTIVAGFDSAKGGAARLAISLSSAGDTWTATGPTDLATFSGLAANTPIFGADIGFIATISNQAFPGLLFKPQILGANGGLGSSSKTASGFIVFDETDLFVNVIPEPATLGLLGAGLLGLGMFARRRRKAA